MSRMQIIRGLHFRRKIQAFTDSRLWQDSKNSICWFRGVGLATPSINSDLRPFDAVTGVAATDQSQELPTGRSALLLFDASLTNQPIVSRSATRHGLIGTPCCVRKLNNGVFCGTPKSNSYKLSATLARNTVDFVADGPQALVGFTGWAGLLFTARWDWSNKIYVSPTSRWEISWLWGGEFGSSAPWGLAG